MKTFYENILQVENRRDIFDAQATLKKFIDVLK